VPPKPGGRGHARAAYRNSSPGMPGSITPSHRSGHRPSVRVGVQRHDALQKGTITPDTAATANGTAHERTAADADVRPGGTAA
jgi:hypothetical protein